MVNPDNLVKGNCYFMIRYIDCDLFIPVIETLIFIESNDKEDKFWIFQEAKSFADVKAEPDYIAIDEDQLIQVLDIKELRAELKSLLHRHPIQDNATSREVKLTDDNRSKILKKVTGIYNRKNSNECISLGTNYRNKRVSI